MVTVTGQPQGRSQNNSSDNYQSYRGNRPQRQDRRHRQNTDGNPVTECGFCNLIKGKNVSQEYLSMDFNERHRNLSHRSIWANNCLPWLKLSFEDRDKVLQNNDLYCKVGLRSPRPGSNGSSCSKENHSLNNGYNGLCVIRACNNHSTICKEHEDENKNRHRILKTCLDWAQNIRSQSSGSELDDMSDVREEFRLKKSTDTLDIFGFLNLNKPSAPARDYEDYADAPN